MNNYINYIGLNDNLPINIKYFKEELFDVMCVKKPNAKTICDIVSVSIDCSINSIKLLNTATRTSNEGNKLSGKKLLIELDFSYSIKYTTDSVEKYLYILNSNTTKIIYIVVPTEIDNVPIEDLVRKKKINVQTYIEDLYADIRSPDEVYIRTLLLTNVNIKP
ncbi:MAG: hypothetical protein ACRC3Y_10570 [Romboutsia sp.]|uniref:hypothetical protein n=1 Tax=Romboutsia sp. TaxID=1965302 RepID=UPI003F3689C6